MKSRIIRSILILLAGLCAQGLTLAETQAPAHPLDALNSREYWTAYEVLRASGQMDPDTYSASVLLHEPPKARSWPGSRAT